MAITNFPIVSRKDSASATTFDSSNPGPFTIDFAAVSGGLKFNSDLTLNLYTTSSGFANTVTISIWINGTQVASKAGWTGGTSASPAVNTFTIPLATVQQYAGQLVNAQVRSSSITSKFYNHETAANTATRPIAQADVISASTSVNISVSPLLSSNWRSPDAVVKPSKSVSVGAQVSSLSATMPNATVTTQKFELVRLPFIDDANLRSGGTVTDKFRADALIMNISPNNDNYVFKIDMGFYQNRVFESAVMSFVFPNAAGEQKWNIYEVSNDWSDAEGDANLLTFGTLVSSVTVPAHNGEVRVEISLDFDFVKSNTQTRSYRLAAQPEYYDTISTLDRSEETKPYFEYRLQPQTASSVVVNAQPMAMTATSPDATATAVRNVLVSSPVATANALLVQPAVKATKNVSINAQTLTASALMSNAVVKTGTSVKINANSLTFDALMTEPTVSATISKSVNINIEALTVNFVALEATPSVQANLEISAESAEIAFESIDPTIIILNPDANIAAHVSLAMAEMVAAEVVAGKSIVAVAEVAEGELTMTMPEFSNASPVLIGAQPMATKLKTLTPRVQGLDIAQFDDEFYNLVRTRVDGDDMFLRFREDSGVNQLYAGITAIDTQNPSISNYSFDVFGEKRINSEPGIHRSMPFNGTTDYLQQFLGSRTPPANNGVIVSTEDIVYQGSTIFHIRTNEKNQVIYRSDGITYQIGQAAGALNAKITSDITLENGAIKITASVLQGQGNTVPFKNDIVGFRDIADGQWHQVAIIADSNFGNAGTVGIGTSIYIDGKLDRRTRVNVLTGKPDIIGRIGTSYFRGELSEIVHFSFNTLDKNFIEQAYYAFFELNPVRPSVMGMTAAMGNNRARGNAKRILALHHRFLPRRAAYISPEGIDTKGLDTLWNTNPDNALIGSAAFVKYGNMYPPFEGTDNDITKALEMFPGAKVSYQSVVVRNSVISDNGFWRDEVTDEMRYIDLQKDIDIEDFDAIIVIDWPGIEFVNRFRATPAANAGAIYDAFLETIKKATFDNGKELMISSPDMAKDLGLVQNFSSRLVKWESDYAIGGYTSSNGKGQGRVPGDYFAAYNNPFTNIEAYKGVETEERRRIAADPSPSGDKANGRGIYYDTHRGQSHRVATTLPGFTDVGGYVLSEETISRRDTSDYKEVSQYSARYLARPSGLRIGDEFLISGPVAQNTKAAELPEISGPKGYNLISFRPEDIRVGVAVLKESAFEYNGTQLRVNSFADYATLIAIPKGSVVDGRVINGKIIIMPNDNTSFSEENLVTMFQDLTIPNGFTSGGDYLNRPFVMPENNQTKAWQYSSWRAFGGRQDQTSVSQKVISGGNGAVALQSVSTTFTSSVLSDIDKYPVAVVPIQLRAWNWLVTVEEELEDGDLRVSAGAFTSDLSMPEVATTGQQAAAIKAQPMVAIAALSRPRQDNTGENTVLALPMNVNLSMTKLQTRYIAEPMTTTLSLPVPEQADGLDLTETIYLTYAGVQEITLSRKDN